MTHNSVDTMCQRCGEQPWSVITDHAENICLACSVAPRIEYLDEYRKALEHQRKHSSMPMSLLPGGPLQPMQMCMECMKEGRYPRGDTDEGRWIDKDFQRKYSWAIPTETALKTIADRSPRGVVEIGAGGGYWAMLLRERGVDVVAYDHDPEGEEGWFSGEPWTEVLQGDHTVVANHPDRTLFMSWPPYEADWTHEVLRLYRGDTVILIGEGRGGCTGTDEMYRLLGDDGCWHPPGEKCDCVKAPALFERVAEVYLPQWMGLHDGLSVHVREGRLRDDL